MAFKKGNTPWNRGIKYSEAVLERMNFSGLKIGRGFFKGQLRVPSYQNVHYWVRTNKGKPIECELCGASGIRLEWANKDHKYHHNLDDYIAMCKPCHTSYDYSNHLCDKGSRWGSIPNKVKGGGQRVI